jgi:[NiFe] hydrogenase diaphorase moiety large subunit
VYKEIILRTENDLLASNPAFDHVAVDSLLDRYSADPHALVQILREAQAAYTWLPRELLSYLSKKLNLPLAHIEGVATFYRFLHTGPIGQYRVLFSDNITDRMEGNAALLNDLCRRLKVKRGVMRDDGRVSVDFCSCTGLCDQGSSLLINYHQVITHLDAERVACIAKLIESQTPVFAWPSEWFAVDDQIRRTDVILNNDFVPGTAIAAALAMGATGLVDQVTLSNLRGRGGAGFVTGKKWSLCRDAKGTEHYMVCNADEGEPGTFKDRVLLTRHAEMVFEGMTLGALAIGARQGMMYLRGEYRYLLESLQATLQRRRTSGLLGANIQGHAGFDFDIDIHLGAGAYVCGEESSLIESLEGKRGTPRIRPPFPAEHGYLGQPTAVDNVETLCAATQVALKGGAWWAKIGTAKSTGTSIHSISGDCDRPGIYEYPMGTSIDRILEDCGAHDTQAVQVGGASGRCLSALDFGHCIAFEDIPSAGAFMIFNRSRDMFEVARNFAGFFAEESCGFCTPCRVGTALVVNTLAKLEAGRGSRADVDLLSDIDVLMHGTTHCGLGGSACNALHDTIIKFRPAYEKRLKSLEFEPAFDLDAELAYARQLVGRETASTRILAHQESTA